MGKGSISLPLSWPHLAGVEDEGKEEQEKENKEKDSCFLSAYRMPGSLWAIFHGLYTIASLGRQYYYPHFTDEETEAQRYSCCPARIY